MHCQKISVSKTLINNVLTIRIYLPCIRKKYIIKILDTLFWALFFFEITLSQILKLHFHLELSYLFVFVFCNGNQKMFYVLRALI